jgi:hypothetical protein
MRYGTFVAAVLLLVPAELAAQTVDGAADWGWGHSTYGTGDERTTNRTFTQGYTLGYRSVFWDPRFVTYMGELTFNRNALTFGQQASHASLSRQTGFRTSANLFAARPFQGSIHAARGIGAESASHPQSILERSGLTLPPGSVPELSVGRAEFGTKWQLSPAGLRPRIELSFDKRSTTVGAGSLEAVQEQNSLQAFVAREGPRVSHALRYQRDGFDNAVSQALHQRYRELGYELIARATARTFATVRAGRRTTFSLFDVSPQFTDIGIGSVRPPPTGEVDLSYGLATLTHQAPAGVSADMTVAYNQEQSGPVGTNALLGTATTRYQPGTGITLHASGTYGERGQDITGTRLNVLTRGVAAGADYTFTRRLLRFGVGYGTGRGWSTSEEGLDGESRLWNARADAGTDVLRIVQLNVGYEQGRSLDELLPLGNQWYERVRASARTALGARIIIDATHEVASIDRGTSPQVFRTRYVQTMATAGIQVTRDRRVSLTAGRFRNRSLTGGDDDNEYIGFSLDGALIGLLRISLTARRERTASSTAILDQDGYYTVGVLTYRVRLFTFSFEHRYTDLALRTGSGTAPLAFTGNQTLFRVGRLFRFTR